MKPFTAYPHDFYMRFNPPHPSSVEPIQINPLYSFGHPRLDRSCVSGALSGYVLPGERVRMCGCLVRSGHVPASSSVLMCQIDLGM